MEIQHLRYFLAVAARLNFTRAAEDLAMSTSPLSRRIKDLERHLGAELFERTPQAVQLTPAGRDLIPLARDVVTRFDDLRRNFGSSAPELVLGMFASAPTRLADRVSAVTASIRPGMTVRLASASPPDLVHRLAGGALDLAIVGVPIAEPELDYVISESAAAGVYMKRNDPRAGEKGLQLADLVDATFVLPSLRNSSVFFVEVRAMLQRAGVTKILDVDDLMARAFEVSSGRAYTIASTSSALPTEQIFGSLGLVSRRLKDLSLVVHTGVAWSRSRYKTDPQLRTVIDAVVGALADPHPEGADVKVRRDVA